jgi:hypothetical protein
MTTFVDTSVLLSGQQAEDQDPVVVVVRSAQGMLREGLGETASADFERNFAAQYSCKNWGSIFDLLLSNAEIVFKKLASADEPSADRVSKTAEGYFEVALSVLSKLETVEDVVSRIEAFLSTMSAASSEPAVQNLKLKLLTTLFNTLSPKAQLRLTVIKGLCKFAGNQHGRFNPQVFSLVRNCDKWIEDNEEWELTDDEKKQIFALIQTVADDEDKVKLLKLQAGLAKDKAERQTLIEQAIVASLKCASILRFTDLSASAKELEDSSKIKQILSVLISGEFEKMEKLLETAQNLNLEKDTVLSKMRVLALVNLLESKSEMTLSHIGENLKTSDPLTVIITAFRAGLVKGSIDEVRGVLNVKAVAVTGQSWNEVSAVLNRIKGT